MEIVKEHFAESMGSVNRLRQNVEDMRNSIELMERTLALQDDILTGEKAEIAEIEADIVKVNSSMGSNSQELCMVEHVERQVSAQQLRLTRHAEFWKMFEVLSALPVPAREPRQRRYE